MKKTLGIMLLVMLLATTGCGNQKGVEDLPEDSGTATEEVTTKENKEERKTYVYFGEESHYQSFLEAVEQEDFSFNYFTQDLKQGTLASYPYIHYYPEKDLVIKTNEKLFFEDDRQSIITDAAVDAFFVKDGESLSLEGFREVTEEQVLFLEALFSDENFEKYLVQNDTKQNAYDLTEGNFAAYTNAYEIYGSAISMFYGEMEARNRSVSDMLLLSEVNGEYTPFLTTEEEMDRNIQLAEEVLQDEKDLYHTEVMNSLDGELSDKHYAIHSLSLLKQNEEDVMYKLKRVNQINDRLEDMLDFYVGLGEFNGEEIERDDLLSESDIEEYKSMYEGYVNTLEEELQNIQLYKEKVAKTELAFLL